jgi:hypothetical protein
MRKYVMSSLHCTLPERELVEGSVIQKYFASREQKVATEYQ